MTLPKDGFNLLGHLSGTIGLSAATRSTARLLTRSGLPVSMTDLPIPNLPAVALDEFQQCIAPMDQSMRYAVNVFHTQPHAVVDLLNGPLLLLPAGSRINAVVPFWELTRFPTPWISQLDAVDFVLAPSKHIKTVIEEAAPEVPVLHFPQGVSVPSDVRPDRQRWNLKADETVFVTSFDVLSDMPRKNPQGSISAFQRAFNSDERVRLVLKMRHADVDPKYSGHVEAVRAAAAADKRLLLIEEDLPMEGLLSLFASADALLSLHRAEGLGLMLMESMAVGTPVIGTAWSGNMDFMNAENSGLVPSKLVPAQGLHHYYAPEYLGGPAFWAEPDLDEAAIWLRRFHDDPELSRTLGASAKQYIERFTADANRIGPFHRLVEEFHGGYLRSARHSRVRETLRGFRWRAVGRAMRRPQAAARRLGAYIRARRV